MHDLNVKMFGSFSVNTADRQISDSDNRSRKVWSLLAYLIYHRNRVLKQEELIHMLWAESEQGVNPTGALKTLFYRVRSELERLWPGVGRALILCHGDGYFWNNQYSVQIDSERFDEINNNLNKQEKVAVDDVLELLQMYEGDFLTHMSAELWVMPISAYYHNIFITRLLQIMPELLEQHKIEEAIRFCRLAAEMEPFNEEIHCWLMRTYVADGKQKDAIGVYQKLSDRLLMELGIIPSEEIRNLYYDAIKTNNRYTLSIEMLQNQLRENDSCPGALVCEYDFFRILHYFMARSVARSGIAVHLALVSVSGKKETELSGKRLEKIMLNLEETVRRSLRRGDAAAKCSSSQFVIMLPRANYENSCMVCERILRAYHQKHINADVEFRYEVVALQMDDKENFQWMREKFGN